MTDDIRELTARLADEPGSLAFLELAEALRRRGQLDAAHKVARGGLTRYPGLADAHDLMARVLSDQGDLAGAFDAWATALQLDPMRTSALKGIGFLYFRAGETAAAMEHLQRALDIDPDDPSIRQAIARLGSASRDGAAPQPAGPRSAEPAHGEAMSVASAPGGPAHSERPQADPMQGEAPDDEPEAEAAGPFDGIDGGDRGLLLVDANGLRLAGRLGDEAGDPAGDKVAAQLAGVSREAARTTRLLGLGNWQAIAVESPDGHMVLTHASPDTVLLAARDASLPMGRVTLLADRAARSARAWLEEQA